MPLDAICLKAVCEELARRITGMRVEKVQQPERDVIILSLRSASGQCRLLISAGPGDARVHATEHRFDNPQSPPMFCMLLRKHLTGAKITKIEQIPSERVAVISMDAADALGRFSAKSLIMEMIGKSSNIILATGDGIIVDCLKRVGGSMADKRAVLPGLFYRPPPPQEGKIDPLSLPADGAPLAAGLQNPTAEAGTVDKWLVSRFIALSPLICREIAWRAYGRTDARMEDVGDGGAALRRELLAMADRGRRSLFEPYAVYDGDKPVDFSFTRILQYGEAMPCKRFDDFSTMLDAYFTASSQLGRARQRASAATGTVKAAHARLSRKLAAQYAELEKTAGRERLRENGDIIMANIHAMKKGQSLLSAQDFYGGDGEVREIALDPLKTPQQNAAKYYKEFAKAKSAEKHLGEQIRAGEAELLYLGSVMEHIALAEDGHDLDVVLEELALTGYVKGKNKPGAKKQAASAPMRFISSSGFEIRAGRSNVQNDALTLRSSAGSDVWMHASKTHGAHVVISCAGGTPDDATLGEAASIAAYYSGARESGKVPIDRTYVKNVKKPSGARPGMVIYTDYKTIMAAPDENLVKRLRQTETN